MLDSRKIAASIAALCYSLLVSAHEPAAMRYRVAEIAAPPVASSSCLAGYARRATGTGINDLGVASGTLRCYTRVEPENTIYQQAFRPFVAATHFGSFDLPLLPEATGGDAVNINNRAEVFGSMNMPQLRGAKWSLAGGIEQVFAPFACGEGFAGLDYALNGNARGYVVGWTFRTLPSLPPPLDTFCLSIGWVIRKPDGTTVFGPVDGVPQDVNTFDVAVGRTGASAIKLHLPSNRQQVLEAGDAEHFAIATDINDLGEAAGYVDVPPPGAFSFQCGPSSPRRWERDGTGKSLSLPEGAVSGRTWAVGYEGEAVGEAGVAGYCDSRTVEQQRAVIWRGTRVIPLNSLIPASQGITLVSAAEVNRRGQIVATGYRAGDPQSPCPDNVLNPQTNFYELDTTLQCHDTRMYVLTPLR